MHKDARKEGDMGYKYNLEIYRKNDKKVLRKIGTDFKMEEKQINEIVRSMKSEYEGELYYKYT